MSADLIRFLETAENGSKLRISISDALDPFFDEDAILGDITGLEHKSNVPLLDEPPRLTPPRLTPPRRIKSQIKKPKKREFEAPLNLQMQSISEVENLELDSPEPLPKESPFIDIKSNAKKRTR